jgi:hypothetical protein
LHLWTKADVQQPEADAHKKKRAKHGFALFKLNKCSDYLSTLERILIAPSVEIADLSSSFFVYEPEGGSSE